MAAATMYVTVLGALAKDGSNWANAMGLAEFLTDINANTEDGDIYYIKAGTYTLTAAIAAAALDATAIAPISLIGVKAATSAEPPTVSDWGTTTDRPVFACGTYAVGLGDYFKLYNCEFSGTATALVTVGGSSVVYNCKIASTYTSSGRTALTTGSYSFVVQCECSATDGTIRGTGIAVGTYTKVIYCYIHDAVTGVNTTSGTALLFCIIDTCTTGVDIVSDDYLFMFGNTVYNTTTAFSATDSFSNAFINNIVDTATDGFLWTTQTDINLFMYNHIGNSVTDMWDLVAEIGNSDLHRDHWVTGPEDPDFTDEAGGNFSLEGTSPCINAGLAMQLGVG